MYLIYGMSSPATPVLREWKIPCQSVRTKDVNLLRDLCMKSVLQDVQTRVCIITDNETGVLVSPGMTELYIVNEDARDFS